MGEAVQQWIALINLTSPFAATAIAAAVEAAAAVAPGGGAAATAVTTADGGQEAAAADAATAAGPSGVHAELRSQGAGARQRAGYHGQASKVCPCYAVVCVAILLFVHCLSAWYISIYL